MADVSLTLAISRLRKTYARNPDVSLVCDELTKRLSTPVVLNSPQRDAAFKARHGFDRKAYQREYMRQWRAKQKTEK
jgi:hypothetical protein